MADDHRCFACQNVKGGRLYRIEVKDTSRMGDTGLKLTNIASAESFGMPAAVGDVDWVE